MSEESTENKGELRSSPVSGCFILLTIIIVFGGLIVLYTVVGLYQNREIDKFTQDTPAAIVFPEVTEQVAERSLAKLRQVGDASEAGESVRVVFSAEELNLFLTRFDVLEDVQGNAKVERITSQGIVTQMSQPMRKGIIAKGVRYLNGVFVFEPELRARTVSFKVVDIRPAEGEIPEGFVENYAILDFFKLDPDNESIRTHIGSISTIYTEANQLVIETKEVLPEEVGDAP
ncbi:MAG: hypothetical protein AAGA96_08540 [Verrucomicrobiota bacterium]